VPHQLDKPPAINKSARIAEPPHQLHCVVVIDDMEYVICNPRMMSKQALEGRNLKACVVSIDVLRQMMISLLVRYDRRHGVVCACA